MSLLPDIALISQVLMFGNRRAFDSLVRKYQAPVRRLLLTLTAGDEALSDDLAQETFIKAYTALESYKNHSNFATWLYRIAYNVFYDYIRSRKETCLMDEVIDEVETAHGQELSDSSITADINEAMRLLRPEERTCVTLHLMEDLPIDKIVEITGMPSGTIKSHVARGRSKLVRYLKNNGYER
ncbi:MAG: sigma-70 family RNA polymerase sigma factor [Bacteroidaceae bacterium]|nr:sigma-70 family RNA polymerase sigma factor [Bacteroidaceae bacterium]